MHQKGFIYRIQIAGIQPPA